MRKSCSVVGRFRAEPHRPRKPLVVSCCCLSPSWTCSQSDSLVGRIRPALLGRSLPERMNSRPCTFRRRFISSSGDVNHSIKMMRLGCRYVDEVMCTLSSMHSFVSHEAKKPGSRRTLASDKSVSRLRYQLARINSPGCRFRTSAVVLSPGEYPCGMYVSHQ